MFVAVSITYTHFWALHYKKKWLNTKYRCSKWHLIQKILSYIILSCYIILLYRRLIYIRHTIASKSSLSVVCRHCTHTFTLTRLCFHSHRLFSSLHRLQSRGVGPRIPSQYVVAVLDTHAYLVQHWRWVNFRNVL